MLTAVDFKWAFTKGKGQERSTFGRLLLLLVCTPHDAVYVHTRELLRKVRLGLSRQNGTAAFFFSRLSFRCRF